MLQGEREFVRDNKSLGSFRRVPTEHYGRQFFSFIFYLFSFVGSADFYLENSFLQIIHFDALC